MERIFPYNNGAAIINRNGLISMSLRTVLELQTYLKEEYPDKYYECTLCMEIVTTDVSEEYNRTRRNELRTHFSLAVRAMQHSELSDTTARLL